MDDTVMLPRTVHAPAAAKQDAAPHDGSAGQSGESLARLNQVLEHRLAQQTAKARQAARQLGALAAELTQAEERERRRLARVLHDDLQQTVSAAYLRISMAKTKTTDPAMLSALTYVGELTLESIATSRSLTSDLCPAALYEGNFASALDWLAREARQKHDLEVHISTDPRAEPGNREVFVVLFRGVRELLFNVAKHAKVREARVAVARAAGRITVTVEDRGVGFDSAAPGATTSGGFGLCSIRDRLAYMGGGLELTGAPGRGTRATLLVPDGCRPTTTAGAPRRARRSTLTATLTDGNGRNHH